MSNKHNKYEEVKIVISRELLVDLYSDVEELLNLNSRRKDTTEANKRYMKSLKDELKQISKLLGG